MSSVVAKMFIQSETIGPDGTSTFQLGVVCRCEENKEWAAATPSGSAKLTDPALAAVWAAKRSGERGDAEVHVCQTPAVDGPWAMEQCAFSYGGCIVKFRQKSAPWGTLELTVNASAATTVLRKAFADGLLSGVAPTFDIRVEDASRS